MRVAVDTSVLLAIVNGEEGSQAWLDILVEARRDGQLLLCEVVYAELAAAFSTRAELDLVLARLGLKLDQIGADAAWLAGVAFKAYRQRGGPRTTMIPDFLVAAHAQLRADALAAVDRGYLRTSFAGLEVLRP